MTTPIPTAALTRFVGVHEDATPAETAARYPGASWTRPFVSDDGEPLALETTGGELVRRILAKTGPALDAGGGSMVSIKLDMKQVAAGQWDERLAQVGVALAGLNVILVLSHEPENDMTGRVFTAGFTVGRAAVKSAAPDVQVAYAAMAWQWRFGAKPTAKPKAWTEVVADLYLVDVYSGKSFPAGAILPEHPGFVRWYSHMIAAHPGRRWGVAERGWQSSTKRAPSIRREQHWLTTDPIGQTCAGVLIWSTGGVERNPGWVLQDRERAAVASYVATLAAR